ncbi:histidine kinase [Paenibacillus allorhizosphaerae]|uniref:HAMP domain-containing sensor histidine kinase n=1 Tax=Paenibacillus allorhizosphaerae TaxID=2849866 RepID=UPI001E5827DF|nr:sensor histidine kinase [Paenibacillus allorhizosphaerae]
MQWKLTLYYILTTIIVMLLLEMMVVLGFYGYMNFNTHRMLATQVGSVAQNAAVNFSGPFINQDKLYQALKDWPLEMGTEFQGYSAAVDSDGRLIAIADDASSEDKTRFGLPTSVEQHIRTVLSLDHSAVEAAATYTYKEKEAVYIVAPIANKLAIRGALVVKAEHIRFSSQKFRDFMPKAFQFFGISLIGFFIGAAIVGLAFGIVTSRSLVRRIQKILTSANRWSQGDFTTFINDPSGDELGQLVHRLNQMAEQLKQLLRTRHDLATMEERNRLARELHDSIKQQMFALSIWVNTGKSLIGQDGEAARSHLAEAEHLISHMQRELSALISELRPVAMQGKSLTRALEDYVHTWQEQTGISADLKVVGEHPISPMIEEALFRITQEALSNTARHSGASAVRLHLECAETMALSIRDNGCGFDAENEDRQGIGLSSMRERVQALGGHIDIRSEKGNGTIITVHCTQNGLQDRN